MNILKKIQSLSTRQIALIFVVTGLAVYFTGLANPFQGDDSTQIVTNLPVHFIQNIGHFFIASTFYDGGQLVGTYYRPLMTTTFSIIYTFFGQWTTAYHVVQLALFTASSFVLFLILRQFLKQVPALLLALLFLVHPINSQIVFSIPTMQDALLLLFGTLAIYFIMCRKSLFAIAAFLLLALFSKETGILFLAMSFLYLYMYDRERIGTFVRIMLAPLAMYAILKIQAVGLLVANAHSAPIGHLNLIERLMTAPSIMAFYFAKLLFPWTLATGWYWTEPKFSVVGVLIPILIDLAVAALFVYLGWRVKNKLDKKNLHLYLFFAVWTVIGIIPYMQITPLDMTACETWFSFSLIGILAMTGIALPTIKLNKRIQPEWIVIIVLFIIGVLGVRTAIRGTDYNSQYNLAMKDLAVSKQNYAVMNNIAQGLIQQKKYRDAITYANLSIGIQPITSNYNNLGVALQKLGDFNRAKQAYINALRYGSTSTIYENLGQIHLGHVTDPATEQFLQTALKKYPTDNRLWLYYSIVLAVNNDKEGAKTAITNAGKYGGVPQALLVSIMKDQPLTFTIPTAKEPITIN